MCKVDRKVGCVVTADVTDHVTGPASALHFILTGFSFLFLFFYQRNDFVQKMNCYRFHNFVWVWVFLFFFFKVE